MNLRQAQRSLAELISKCEAAHIQLPKDPLEARAEAVETIIHSSKDGKPNLDDAQEELHQKFGLELAWKQQLENEEAKRQRRRQSRQIKGNGRGKSVASPSQGSTSLGSITEAPAQGNPLETRTYGENAVQSARTLTPIIPKVGVMTLSKRPVASQETRNIGMRVVAKKAKSAQRLIVSGAPSETEDKPPPRSAPGLGSILSTGDNDMSASSGSPGQGIADLLDLEDLDEVERGSGMSSDEDFAL